jgi:hypothetical protein
MKGTLTHLAAMLVSTLALNSASAQAPYPVAQAGSGYPAGYAQAEYSSNYGGAAQGCAGGNCGGGGCASGKCGGGCGAGGKYGILNYLKCAGCPGCEKPQLFKKKDDCGKCSALKGWLCRPCPSDAPVLRKAEYPLGFPTHPYARSPRDYFMTGGQ